MSRFIKISALACLVIGLAGTSAFAGGHHGHHHGGYGGHGRVGTRYFYNTPSYGYVRPYYGGNYGPVFHDTSHWDYHGPTIVPHRNHFHVTPGHYHYHQSGHWHH
ncbi:hypothetical protein [Planctomicrobium sp. SH664]|uniref:hypothetical protein n=1 Tax=Planctomicrobium sp. SH664 TaxID=3448125 RepID=UPI003F5C11AE